MAKVFATLISNNRVIIKEWRSKRSFEATESYLDDKYIFIATTDDFKGKSSFPLAPMYTYRVESGSVEAVAHNLLYNARNNYLNISN